MSDKVSCIECGAEILPATAERTGGKCMPCFKDPDRGRRLRLDKEAERDPALRVPCVKCGKTILPSTFERTGGLCMPCDSVRKSPLILGHGEESDFIISYTVKRSPGDRLTHLLGAAGGEHIILFQSARDLPDEIRRAREYHSIYAAYPTREKTLSAQNWAEIKDMVYALSVPILGNFFGGFDGTHYYLRITRGMSHVEFYWWVDLPAQWAPLTKIIETLTAPFTQPAA